MLVENEGWKAQLAFAPFLKAVTNITDMGHKTLANRNFFVEAPNCFFKRYKEMFVKHVAKNVFMNDVVICLIGGNATLARKHLNWLAVAEESSNVDNYIFPSKQLQLGKEHGVFNDTSLVIDTRKCLRYLTATVDLVEILKDRLIVKCKDHW